MCDIFKGETCYRQCIIKHFNESQKDDIVEGDKVPMISLAYSTKTEKVLTDLYTKTGSFLFI